MGKVPRKILEKHVFPYLGAPNPRLIKGPLLGEDAAIIDQGDKVMVAKANPITGAVRGIGWLAVHINANDVATRGARPTWYFSIILLPEDSEETLLEEIMQDQHRACNKLGISIAGGHTEVAPGLSRPIVAGFMLGEAPRGKYFTTSGAQVGDHILMTKGAGLEGTSILATDLYQLLREELPPDTLSRAQRFLEEISIVPEAMIASQTPGTHAMHTPTEGGILNGLVELTEPAKLGFKVHQDQIPVRMETRAICQALQINPLSLLSSGSLLIAIDPGHGQELKDQLRASGIEANIIGEVTQGGYVLVGPDGSEQSVEPVEQDELFRILESQG